MNQDNPLISIIVPVCNVEHCLHQCIESIQFQTYANWELILVNDGSKDTSGSICDEFSKKDTRIKAIHQKNVGVSTARNKALDIAQGRYITFIDSDDWVDKDYLSSFMKYPLSDNCIVCQGVFYDYTDKTDLVVWDADVEYVLNFDSADKKKEIWHSGYICSKLFSKKIIEKVNLRFNESLHLNEDHIFFYQYLLNIQKIILLSYTGYHYMHRETSSLSKKMQTSNAYFLASNMFLALYPQLESHFGKMAEKYVADCVQMYGLNQLMMGIFSFYLKHYSRKVRYKMLYEKKIYKYYFKKYYHPRTLKTRIFYLIYLFLPIFIQDFLFEILTIKLGKNLKKIYT